MDSLQRVAHGLAELRYLEACVGGVTTTVVEEVANIVRLEDLNEALILRPVLLQAFQLVAAGTECARWRGQEACNGAVTFLAGDNQVFMQRTDYAIAPGVDLADSVAMLAGRFNNATGARIDDGCDAT